jgi:hypothetical protein
VIEIYLALEEKEFDSLAFSICERKRARFEIAVPTLPADTILN